METMLAWIGEDELGSGEVGVKRVEVRRADLASIPGYLVPMVLLEGQSDCLGKLTDERIVATLQRMADQYGRTLRLVRFREVETVLELQPRRP